MIACTGRSAVSRVSGIMTLPVRTYFSLGENYTCFTLGCLYLPSFSNLSPPQSYTPSSCREATKWPCGDHCTGPSDQYCLAKSSSGPPLDKSFQKTAVRERC